LEKIHWLEEAIEDLNQIYIFISQDSVYYAIKTTEEILKRADGLKRQPYIGRRIIHDNENIREIIYKSYRIIYKIDSNIILILRVWHSARLLSINYIPIKK
jgi:plasmid stabilization system protein ParE